MDITQLSDAMEMGAVGVLIILMGMIKVPKMEINFWGWLGRLIGRAINVEVIDKVNGLTEDVDSFKKEVELDRVRAARKRILRFSDEILFEQIHSKEHFDEILEDIDLYETYCREHPEYENNRAELSIATIREIYKKCLHTHNFLSHTKKED